MRRFALKIFFFLLFPFLPPTLRAQDAVNSGNDPVEDEYAEDDFYGEDPLLMEDGGITVVGIRETTQQMAVVSREEIEKAHAPDIPSLLEQTLGLGAARYGPYGNMTDVNIRGFDTERVAVLVDGVPVNSTRSGEFDFNSIDVNSVERIEVVYGGSDTKYNVSGALGGVINIITVKKQPPGWVFGGGVSNVSALPGRYNEQYGGVGNPKWRDLADTQNADLFAAYGAGNYSFRANLFGNRAGNHFLYRDYYGYARRKEGNEVWDGGASASFLRGFSDLSKLIVTGDAYYGDRHIPASGYTAEHAEQKDFSSRQNIMLDMPRAFRDDFSMELSLGHSWGILNYDPGIDPSRHRENSLTLINRWGWYPAAGFTLRFGGDYRFIHLNSTNDGVRNGNRGGLYLTSEYAPVRKLLLIASVKGVTDGKSVIPVPKFGLAWKIRDTLILKNNYFRSFKFPDFDDLYWVQQGFMGNPDLTPEDGWGADLSAEWMHGDLLTFNSSFYWEWAAGSIHWNNASGSWRPENLSRGAFLGWDNRLKVTLPFAPFFLEKPVLSLSWQFQLSWLLSETAGFSGGARIPYMPMHILGFSLELPWKTGSLAVSGRYESLRFADTGNLIKLAPYFLLNITANQEVSKNIAVFGSLRNALNTQYVSFAEYPMPGLTVTLGLRMNIEVPPAEKAGMSRKGSGRDRGVLHDDKKSR
jgi:vitamin B12 transporter